MEINKITEQIIGAAIAVHRELGPGLLESAYQSCLTWEFQSRGLRFEVQKAIPVIYKGYEIDCSSRLDFIVDNAVVVEIKAAEKLADVHLAQMLTYLKLTGCKVGLLINFNVGYLKDGIHRVVLGL